MWKFYLLKALNQQPYTIRYLNPILTYMFSPTGLCILENIHLTQFCVGLHTHMIFYNIHFLVRDQTLLSREACVFFYPVFQYFFFLRKRLLCGFGVVLQLLTCSGLGGDVCTTNMCIMVKKNISPYKAYFWNHEAYRVDLLVSFNG